MQTFTANEAANRLQQALDQSANDAERAGLTPEQLEDLLADES